jgi:glutaredoxin 3
VAKVQIYTTMFCPFCVRAKSLLKKKGVEFEEIEVDSDPELRRQMTERSGGGYTVPQIFIDDQPIGGSDDLAALEASGKLDGLLGTP